jgi:hypothetical protein
VGTKDIAFGTVQVRSIVDVQITKGKVVTAALA